MNIKKNQETAPNGYEDFGFNEDRVKYFPKIAEYVKFTEKNFEFQALPILTEDEVKFAFINSKNPKLKHVKEIIIKDIQPSVSYRYILKSFYETRSVKWIYEPYDGESLICNHGHVLLPWEIIVEPKMEFQNEIIEIKVPNTERILSCHVCNSISGKLSCSKCHGRGKINCEICSGKGFAIRSARTISMKTMCLICLGEGHKACSECSSGGFLVCDSCNGFGKLKLSIRLIIRFDTHVDEYIKKSENITDNQLKSCDALSIYTERNSRVFNFNFSDEEISKVNLDLITFQNNELDGSRVLIQEQSLFAIPVTLAKYQFKESDYVYTIYGLDKQIHFNKYPTTSFTCSIS